MSRPTVQLRGRRSASQAPVNSTNIVTSHDEESWNGRKKIQSPLHALVVQGFNVVVCAAEVLVVVKVDVVCFDVVEVTCCEVVLVVLGVVMVVCFELLEVICCVVVLEAGRP